MNDVQATVVADLLDDSLRQGKTPFLTISSNSMAPLLVKGDQIGLAAVSAAALRPGDIIVVRTPAELLTHRYWGQVDGQLVSRGDRPLSFDPPWAPAQIVGQVVTRRRNGRELSLQNGSGRWLNQRLFAHARAESWLFAGFAPQPFAAPLAKSRPLGRLMRRDRRHLLPRLVRRTILSVNHGLCLAAGWQNK